MRAWRQRVFLQHLLRNPASNHTNNGDEQHGECDLDLLSHESKLS